MKARSIINNKKRYDRQQALELLTKLADQAGDAMLTSNEYFTQHATAFLDLLTDCSTPDTVALQALTLDTLDFHFQSRSPADLGMITEEQAGRIMGALDTLR